MTIKFDGSSHLGTMLALSLLLHVAFIAGVKFHAPDLSKFKDQLPQLEVVLVNAKTETAPEQAAVLAQANLDRGGNTDEKERAKTPLPVPKVKPRENAVGVSTEQAIARQQSQKSQSKPQDSLSQKEEKVRELEQQVKQVIDQAKSPTVTEKAPSPTHEKAASKPLKLDMKEIAANSLNEAARLEAELAKEQKAYQERPWRRFVGSRAKEYRFAAYVEAWRQKVERIGNLNYPEEAKTQKLYGRLRMTVSIKADGSIEGIEINESSGFKVLDDAAKRIVELGAPYAPFPEEIKKDTDILGITRTWTFTREDTWFSQ